MSLSYRREIDGLRAIAVTSVILYHAGLAQVGGGYIGVDIFFVISGYLITTILVSEAEAGHVSIVRFYERRVRRILPALLTVILATLPFAWAWMLPEQLRDYGKSLVAVMVFASNILFWRQSDYFAPAAEEKPMLHTWSLAVEEQFYVFFPLVVALLWRFGARRFTLLVWATALVSLAVSDWASRHAPTANFYLLPSRAWELLAGSLCALWHFRHPLRGHQGLAALGLAMLVVPIFLYTAETPFPGRYAVVPVAGTALVILFATSGTWTGKLLGLKPMVGIGLVSYSAYLWHQPLFAFARIRTIGPVPAELMAALILATFLLAALSWRFVEQPFRGRAPLLPRRRPLFASMALASLIVAAIGTGLWRTDGLPSRLPPETFAVLAEKEDRGIYQACLDGRLHGLAFEDCGLGDAAQPKADFILIGDSLAGAIATGLGRAAEQVNRRGLFLATQGCPALLGLGGSYPPRAGRCEELQDRMIGVVREQGVRTVYLASAWRAVRPANLCAFSRAPCGADPEEAEAFLRKQVFATLHGLSQSVGDVHIIGSPPRADFSLPDAVAKGLLYGDRSDIRIDRAVWHPAFFLETLDAARGEFTSYIDLEPSFCDGDICFLSRNGMPRFVDATHMTRRQALELAEVLKPSLLAGRGQ
ncbi:acyltransferase [Tabrizicola sp. J26]|uniref:acyltransferase family protein n=1 Tax=Alitabrizicola rongguiensis TaxID=2909234 RepID=UPI001F1DB69F|nr:acyltransferase family protein [Tabrizicola rongguiensis]MCF1711116.1 acyltransferase [Tabrizicola rongguiensis]